MAAPPHGTPRDGGPRFAPLGGHEHALADGEGPDGGDVMHLRIHGRVELSDLQLILDQTARVATQHGRGFLIVHMVGTGGISPEARRYYNEHLKRQKTDNVWSFILGASLIVQTLTMLILRGTKLLTGKQTSVQMVKSEAEALTQIAKLRARQLASGQPGP